MCYTQLFNLLCDKADDVYGGRLPVHVRCLIDECANIGQIPKLEKLMATIRSREISACLVSAGTEPAQGHLQGYMPIPSSAIWIASIVPGWQRANNAERAGGSSGKGDHRHLQHSERAVAGRPPMRLNYQKLGKGADEPGRACRYGRRQVYLAAARCAPIPFSDKYDITQAPQFQVHLPTADDKNAFDIEAFLSA